MNNYGVAEGESRSDIMCGKVLLAGLMAVAAFVFWGIGWIMQ